MAVQLEFNTMAELLEPGHHQVVFTHFGLSEEFGRRMTDIAEGLTLHVNEVLRELYATGDSGEACECHMLKKVFDLVDQYVKPSTIAEIACASYVASSMMGAIHQLVAVHVQKVQAGRQGKAAQPYKSYSDNGATA